MTATSPRTPAIPALAPGATRDIVVTFGPTNTGLKNAALRFTSDDPDENPLDVALTGSGVLPDISVNPTSLDYGNVLVGTTASLTFTIENTGNAALQVTSTALIGIDIGLFSITSGGGSFSVAPGDSHTVNVAFQPTSTGAKNATLQITSDDPDENPVDVALIGTGVLPDIAVNPTSLDYGNVPVGTTASQTFHVQNAGSSTLNVSTTSLTGTHARAGVGRQIQIYQGLGKSVEFSSSDAIFKAGQGWLRGQISTAFRQSLCQRFEGRGLGQKSSIVGILINQSNGKKALFQEG